MSRRSAAAALVAAVLLLGGCTDDGEDADGSATRVTSRGDVTGDTVEVLVPTGTLRLTVGDPRDRVPADLAADARDHDAPEGMAYVGLQTQFLTGAGIPEPAATLMADPEEPVRVGLEATGLRTELEDATDGGSRTFVQVPGGGRTFSITVDFDGVRQRVAFPGGRVAPAEAAALTRIPAPEVHRCRPTPASPSPAARCTVTSLTLPYLGGQGWSETGWSAFQVETRTPELRVDGGSYRAGDVTDDSRLDGAAPGWTRTVDSGPGYLVSWLAGDGPVEELDLRRSVSADLVSGDGPDRRSIVIRAQVRP